jgi:predicted ester cyclase
MLFEAFPDLHVEIHDLLELGDKVVTRKTFHGTHDGDFVGLAPTGRNVAWNVIDIVRFREGQMVEHWDVIDIFGLLQQLGAVFGSDGSAF